MVLLEAVNPRFGKTKFTLLCCTRKEMSAYTLDNRDFARGSERLSAKSIESYIFDGGRKGMSAYT